TLPAALDELPVGFLEAGGRRDLAVDEGAAFGVALLVEGRDHVFAEARALREDRLDHVGGRLAGARQSLVVGGIVEHLVDEETHVPERGFILRHRYLRIAARGGSRPTGPRPRA